MKKEEQQEEIKPKGTEYLFKEIASSSSSNGERSNATVIINVKTGESTIRVEKTISKRFPIQEYDDAMDLYDRLGCGGGRRVWDIEELAQFASDTFYKTTMMNSQPNASMEGGNKREHVNNAEIGNGKPYAFDKKDVGITRFGSISKELIGEEFVPGYYEIESIDKPNASMEELRAEFNRFGSEVSPDNKPASFEEIGEWFLSRIPALLKEAEERVLKTIKDIPYGQSGNADYDRGWDDCKRVIKVTVGSLSITEPSK